MSEPQEPSRAGRVVGTALAIFGALLAIGAGLCTGGMFLGVQLSGDGGPGSGAGMAGLSLMVGGPFVVVGCWMWWGGIRLRRE